MLPSEIPRLTTDPPGRVFPGVWKHLFLKTPFPGRISIPISFVSLFIFYILSYLLLKTMGCLSGFLVSSTSVQLFCGICSVFKWSFDEFVGEKVVSPSYSSTILGLPLTPCFKYLSACSFLFKAPETIMGLLNGRGKPHMQWLRACALERTRAGSPGLGLGWGEEGTCLRYKI